MTSVPPTELSPFAAILALLSALPLAAGRFALRHRYPPQHLRLDRRLRRPAARLEGAGVAQLIGRVRPASVVAADINGLLAERLITPYSPHHVRNLKRGGVRP